MGKYHVRVGKRGKKIWLILIDSNPSEKKQHQKSNRDLASLDLWQSVPPHPGKCTHLRENEEFSREILLETLPHCPIFDGKGWGRHDNACWGGVWMQEFFSMKSFSRASRIVLLLMGKGEGRRENVCWGLWYDTHTPGR